MSNGPRMISMKRTAFVGSLAGLAVAGLGLGGAGVAALRSNAVWYYFTQRPFVEFEVIGDFGPVNGRMVKEESLTVAGYPVPVFDNHPIGRPGEEVLFSFRFLEGEVDPFRCCYGSGASHYCITVWNLPCPPA